MLSFLLISLVEHPALVTQPCSATADGCARIYWGAYLLGGGKAHHHERRERTEMERRMQMQHALLQPFLLVTPIPLSNIATLTSYLVLLCVRSLARSNLSLTD